ncbi:MAG: NAD(P)-dependent oxidoreductase [Pyrinomonadaceae bacterium]
MRELVLGGEGLIGSTLAQKLRRKGHEVVSLDLKSGFDLRKPFDLAPFQNCDRVWFLAWDTGGAKYLEAENQQHQQYTNNCEISLRVFDTLAQTKKPFLFATSQLAGLPNAYGTTKLMAWRWSESLGGKVARLWNVYGWEHPTIKSHVITDLVLSGCQGQVRCLTDGLERRRFLYKTDCVDALVDLFEGPHQTAEIAAGEWVTIRHVAELVARQLDVDPQFGDLKGSECLVDPCETLPDWRPKVSLPEGISQVIAEARVYLGERSAAV